MGKSNLRSLLLTALIVLVSAAAIYYTTSDGGEPEFKERKLLGDIQLGDIAEISLTLNDTTTSLRIDGDAWGLVERNGYPIQFDRLNRMLIALGQMRATDRMTSNPDNYERMGVAPSNPSNGTVLVKNAQGELMAGIYVGNERMGQPAQPGGFAPPIGQYVRLESDSDPWVYQVKEPIIIDSDPGTWLIKEIVEVDSSSLQTILVENRGTTDSFHLARIGDEPFELASEIPEGFEAAPGGIGTASRAMTRLTLIDVFAADSPEVEGIDFATTYRAVTKNGVVYVVQTAMHNGEPFINLAAEYDLAADLSLSDERTSDTLTAKGLELAEVTVNKINEKHSPWVYQIVQFKYDDLSKTFSDLLDEVAADEEDPPELTIGPPGIDSVVPTIVTPPDAAATTKTLMNLLPTTRTLLNLFPTTKTLMNLFPKIPPS